MIIEDVYPINGVRVETNEGDYIRYASDIWYQTMGESEEPLYRCEVIESLYQSFIRNGEK